MRTTCQLTIAALVTFAMVITDSPKTMAQCNGGGGSSSRAAAASSSRFAGLSSGSPALQLALASRGNSRRYPGSPALAMQQPESSLQQQMRANQQQALRQQAEQRYQKKRELPAVRRERAVAKRAAREERALARLEEESRSGDPSGPRTSGSLYAFRSQN